MAGTYEFMKADRTMVCRGPDNAFVPWNPATNTPADVGGYVYRVWQDHGSPIPSAYDPAKWPP